MKIFRRMLLAVLILCLIPLGQAGYASLLQRQQERTLKELREAAEPERDGGEQGEENAAGADGGQGEKNTAGADGGQGEENAAGADDGQGEGTASGAEGGRGEWTASEAADHPGETIPSGGNPQEEPADSRPPVMEKYEALYEKNHDLTGWLFIEGTNIDYPVMQREDDEYYLHHDFYGNDSKYGCLYVRDTADVITPGTNFIIYGHNMKDGSMFGDLDLYQKESFWREHPTICFDTLYEERTYEVIAVFPSRVYHSDEAAFKYYQFYNADTQEEFDYFYENIKNLSLYDTGVTAGFGDTFLTLSTCAYHTEDGRFVVVAKATDD